MPENILPSGSDTLLAITSLGGFRYQARGLTQTLEHIGDASQLERDVNGYLIDISNPAFRKFATKITCSDSRAPPLDGLWPGMQITVYSAAMLCYLNGNPGSPARSAVAGSTFITGHYTFYRPILTMLVKSFSQGFEEWKSDYQWSLEAEEI